MEVRVPERPEPLPLPPSVPDSGLSLGGPPPAGSTVRGEPDPAPPVRRSIRDQIASLGTRMTLETAKQTVNLDSREPRFLEYLAHVKRRIQDVWIYPQEARAMGIGGELLLVFTLNSAGTLTDVRLLDGSGFPVLDEEALRAVKLAAPYDPFPPELGDQPWNITASFQYYAARHFRRR
jgi:TonB family protein